MQRGSVPKVLFNGGGDGFTKSKIKRWRGQREICDLLAPPRCGPGIGHEIGILFQGASALAKPNHETT